MNWKAFGISAGLTIVVPSVILGMTSHDPGGTGIWFWSPAIPIATGIAVGECVFFVLSTLARRRYGWVCGVSSILSGLVALLAGGFLGVEMHPVFHSVVFEPHPDFALGHEDSLFYQGLILGYAMVAGLAGLIFGAGIGQRTGRNPDGPR